MANKNDCVEVRIVEYFPTEDRRSLANQGNLALYAVFGKGIVYSGTRNKDRVSTLSAALHIVDAICEAEGILPEDFAFFDLLTCRGYQELQSGAFRFVRLQLGVTDLEETSSSEGDCVTRKRVTLEAISECIPSNQMKRTFKSCIFWKHKRNFKSQTPQ